ncbi:unnamed protein product [Rotaria sp. Silwood1]|nr:unnamed protein product [Rotaria sp. Silwood1]
MVDNDKTSKFTLENIIHNLDQNELNSECQAWALVHGKSIDFEYLSLILFLFFNLFPGFVQRCFTQEDNTQNDSNVVPYPFTIYPSPFPCNEYEKACQIQYGINIFVQHLAFDTDLMDSILKNLVECDPFIRRLRNIYHQIQQLPYKSSIETCIIRTDYMLQQLNTFSEKTKLRLIELNTIAVGLGAAAKLIQEWHKRFLKRIQPELLSKLPKNESYDLIIDTLFESWKIYNNSRAIILFVIPENEFNIGDQMLIEKGLLSYGNSSLLIKHVTFFDICRYGFLDSKGILYFGDFEVALIYYRSAYDPKHFYHEDIWQAYIMLESSRAIKCPSLRYHLAGMKCFQLALIEKNFLEKIFQGHEKYIDDFRDIIEEMFTIDQAINDPILQQRILDKPKSFYLKQSREGGTYSTRKESMKECI